MILRDHTKFLSDSPVVQPAAPKVDQCLLFFMRGLVSALDASGLIELGPRLLANSWPQNVACNLEDCVAKALNAKFVTGDIKKLLVTPLGREFVRSHTAA